MQIANKIYPIEIFSMLKKPAFYVIYSITTVVKVEIDIITSTAASLSLAVKLVTMYVNTFKTDGIVFIIKVIMCLASH
jgi:hypothetical protein